MKAGPEPLTFKGSPGPGDPTILTIEDVERKGYLDDPKLLEAMDLAHRVQAEKLGLANKHDYGLKQAVRHKLHHNKLASDNMKTQKAIIDLAIEKQKRGNIV